MFSPKRSLHQRPATKALYGSYMSKGNPLGWNNFGSFTLDESKSRESSSFEATQESVLPGVCGKNTNVQLPTSIDEDLGFTWERSNEESLEHSKNDEVDQSVDTEKYTSKKTHNEEKLKEEESQSSLSSIDSDESSESSSSQSSSSSKSFSKAAKETNPINSKPTTNTATNTHDDSKVLISEGRHTLFIQMQLCSIRTLGDFLANHRARSGTVSPSSGSMTYAVDVPFALRLFGQIANGVKYVHKQGLIHRDLKPQVRNMIVWSRKY